MNWRMVVVLAFVCAALTVPATALASVESFKFHGNSAFATFSGPDPSDACIQVAADVFVSEGLSKEGPGKPETVSQLFVQLVRFNTCTGEVLVSAFGSPTLSAEAFQVDKLNTATLNATVEVCDSVSDSCGPATINLTWMATGEVVRDKFSFHSDAGRCKIRSQSLSTSRAAVATGSVVAFGTNFTLAPSLDAQIASVKQGSIEINCP
jgi:hypothetical protein